MNQSKRTKKTLISSIVALVLCLAMLIGSTLAWFTDTISVTADINVGSLKVALEKYVDGEYKNIGTKDGNAGYTESTEPVFGGTGWTPKYWTNSLKTNVSLGQTSLTNWAAEAYVGLQRVCPRFWFLNLYFRILSGVNRLCRFCRSLLRVLGKCCY